MVDNHALTAEHLNRRAVDPPQACLDGTHFRSDMAALSGYNPAIPEGHPPDFNRLCGSDPAYRASARSSDSDLHVLSFILLHTFVLSSHDSKTAF